MWYALMVTDWDDVLTGSYIRSEVEKMAVDVLPRFPEAGVATVKWLDSGRDEFEIVDFTYARDIKKEA